MQAQPALASSRQEAPGRPDSPRPQCAGRLEAGPSGTELGDGAAGRAGWAYTPAPGPGGPVPAPSPGTEPPEGEDAPWGLCAVRTPRATPPTRKAHTGDTKRGALVPTEPRVDTCGEPGRVLLLTCPVLLTGPGGTQKGGGKVLFCLEGLASPLGARGCG